MRVERHWGSLSPSVSLSLYCLSRSLARSFAFARNALPQLQQFSSTTPSSSTNSSSSCLHLYTQDQSPSKISGRPPNSLVRLEHAASTRHQERRLQSTTTPGSCVYRRVICRSPFGLFRLRSAALQRSCALLRSAPSSNGCYVIGDAVMISRSVMISVHFHCINASAVLCF